MCFRNVSDFNTSLLGKHYWRLLTDGNSLLGMVLKGRYYLRGNIYKAKVGFRPSFTWISILSSRDVVTKGSRLRIGKGESVRIWSDDWLLENLGFKVLSFANNPEIDIKVSNLIGVDMGLWN